MKKHAFVVALALALPFSSTAHKQWLVPSQATVAGQDVWVTFDAAVSNQLFFPDHVPMRLDNVVAIAPDGSHIFYGNRSAGGGTLDVDMNVYEDECGPSAVENIYFPDPMPGEYAVSVVNYTDRTDGDTPAVVRVTIGNKQKVFNITVGSYSCSVTRFKYGEDGGDSFEWLED